MMIEMPPFEEAFRNTPFPRQKRKFWFPAGEPGNCAQACPERKKNFFTSKNPEIAWFKSVKSDSFQGKIKI
jgi:hypothetical protein